jgi:SAM-dependent methyltransferase
MTVFNHYARYYDLLYKDKNYAAEANYIDQLIQTYKPSSQTILELGCGTGLHAALLTDKKYFVHGIDQSEDMIEKALIRKAASSKLSFAQADVRDYRGDEKYDVVISIFHVMSYQTTNEDLLAAFKTAQAHLKPGGIFIFDCWYGAAVLTEPPVVRVKRIEDDKISVVRLAEPTLYPNQNCVDVNYTVWIRDKKTDQMEEIKETHRMRYLFQPEIEQMLALSGLSLINAQEWLTGNELGFNTWNGCFVAENK